MKQQELFTDAGHFAPVRSYRNLAIKAFRNTARSAFDVVRESYHWEDWIQECDLAAWQCEQDQLGVNAAVRFCSRACYRFLRNVGFRKPTGGRRLEYGV